MKLFDERFPFEEVLAHPRHQAAQKSLVELIVQLRACANAKDGYEFQQALPAEVLAVEADHNAFSRTVKLAYAGSNPAPATTCGNGP